MGCRVIRMVLTAKYKEQDYTSLQEKAGNFSKREKTGEGMEAPKVTPGTMLSGTTE
jgi:hypothetical protein